MKKIVAMPHRSFETTTIPWGSEARSIYPHVESYFPFSGRSPDPDRKAHAELSVYLGQNGNLYIPNHTQHGIFMHCLQAGQMGKSVLQMSDRKIIDIAINEDNNCFVLRSSNGKTVVSKVASDGNSIWTAEMGDSNGSEKKLFFDHDGHLYLTLKNKVKILDANTGGLLKTINLRSSRFEKTFVTGSGKIVRSVYFGNRDGYDIAIFDPQKGKETIVTVKGKEENGFLHYPFGVDDELNMYVCRYGGSSTPGISKISAKGNVTQLISFDDIVLGLDGTLYTSYFDKGKMMISGQNKEGEKQSLTLQASSSDRKFQRADRLIKVDEAGSFYFHVDESPYNVGKLLVFTKDGKSSEEKTSFDLLELGSYRQKYSSWKVDSKGNIYLFITSNDGFHVAVLSD